MIIAHQYPDHYQTEQPIQFNRIQISESTKPLNVQIESVTNSEVENSAHLDLFASLASEISLHVGHCQFTKSFGVILPVCEHFV